MPLVVKVGFLLVFPFILLMSAVNSDASAHQLITSTLLPGYFVIFLMGGLAILALMQIYKLLQAIPKTTHTDITHEANPLPKPAHPYLAVLEQWGFVYLGQVLREIPGQVSKIVWVLTRADGYITAEITESKDHATVEFDTFFADLALLETTIAKELSITLPDYRAISGFTGLVGMQEAYQTHQQAASEMMQTHGRPIPVQSLQAYLNASKVFPERHAVPATKVVLRRMMVEAAPFLYLVFWTILLTLLILMMDGYKPVIGYVMGFLILPVLGAAFVPKKERMW